jgi:hypothetical protein
VLIRPLEFVGLFERLKGPQKIVLQGEIHRNLKGSNE